MERFELTCEEMFSQIFLFVMVFVNLLLVILIFLSSNSVSNYISLVSPPLPVSFWLCLNVNVTSSVILTVCKKVDDPEVDKHSIMGNIERIRTLQWFINVLILL